MLTKLHNAKSIFLKIKAMAMIIITSIDKITVEALMVVFEAMIFAKMVEPPALALPLRTKPSPTPTLTPPNTEAKMTSLVYAVTCKTSLNRSIHTELSTIVTILRTVKARPKYFAPKSSKGALTATIIIPVGNPKR